MSYCDLCKRAFFKHADQYEVEYTINFNGHEKRFCQGCYNQVSLIVSKIEKHNKNPLVTDLYLLVTAHGTDKILHKYRWCGEWSSWLPVIKTGCSEIVNHNNYDETRDFYNGSLL